MKPGRKVLMLAGICVACVSGGAAWAASGDDAVKKRQAAMKQIGGQMKVIKDYLGGNGTAADVVQGATTINGLSKSTPALFVDGTARGDTGLSVETEALASIWQDAGGFENAWKVLTTESEKLAQVAATENRDAIAAQFGTMAKNGCGGCHKSYRLKK